MEMKKGVVVEPTLKEINDLFEENKKLDVDLEEHIFEEEVELFWVDLEIDSEQERTYLLEKVLKDDSYWCKDKQLMRGMVVMGTQNKTYSDEGTITEIVYTIQYAKKESRLKNKDTIISVHIECSAHIVMCVLEELSCG